MHSYKSLEVIEGKDDFKWKFLNLKFINKENMRFDTRKYGANNIVHCFSKEMNIDEWFHGLTENELGDLKINNYSIYDFLLGDETLGKVKEK